LHHRPDHHGLAADLTVFDVALRGDGIIDQQGDDFAAAKAGTSTSFLISYVKSWDIHIFSDFLRKSQKLGHPHLF
jgi:hypothetical protein